MFEHNRILLAYNRDPLTEALGYRHSDELVVQYQQPVVNCSVVIELKLRVPINHLYSYLLSRFL